MADLPTWLRIPDGFASSGDPIDANPFQPEDARHQVWRDATRRAEEECARVNARSFSSLSPDNVYDWFATCPAARFSVWAERGIQVVWTDVALRQYDQWLVRYANASLEMLTEFFARNPPPVSPDPILLNTRNKLGEQVQYWKAEARRYRAEQEDHQRTSHVDEMRPTAPEERPRSDGKTADRSLAPSANVTTWSEVEIRFLSDLKVQSVVKGKTQEPQNYAELGFADGRGRGGKPRAAWDALRRLAESNGAISSTPSAREWPKLCRPYLNGRQI